MTAENLAMIFAPSLLWSAKNDRQLAAAEHTGIIPTVHLLITCVDDIFAVPFLPSSLPPCAHVEEWRIQIPADILHKMLMGLSETDPEQVDQFLDRFSRVAPPDKAEPTDEMATTVFYISQQESYPDEVTCFNHSA